jgi:FtsP/CotA-like multicopper oxidase with cupredoxin domain
MTVGRRDACAVALGGKPDAPLAGAGRVAMQAATLLALLLAVAPPPPPAHGGEPHHRYRPRSERARINDNRRPAGTLRRGVLTLQLEARVATWHPDADDGPGVEVQAFAERGRAPEIPGPLVRVPAGTVVDLTVRNAILGGGVLVVHGLSSRPSGGGGAAEADSIRLPSGETRRLRFRLDAPGTYYYWGTTTGRRFGMRFHEDAQLTGAIVVDEPPRPGSAAPRRDRVLVIGMMADTVGSETQREDRARLLFVINGRSWPHTERLSYALGDTIVWRVLNTTADPHPMHLHGAYFRVESRGDGRGDTAYAADRRDVVNTQLLRPGMTMLMSWTPVHEGNWLFHCHVPEHFGPRGPLGVLREPDHDGAHAMAHAMAHATTNHALQGMSGLVMGVVVRSARGGTTKTTAAAADPGRRRLRLLVRTNGGSTPAEPFYGYALHERGAEPPTDSGFRSGPTIVLVRGQPVGITVVNRTDAPTAVHWHGIELESYNDGVAGFSGIERRLTPVVAPGDSFEARFTPPRAGTFMYHTHVDESRQQRAGLAGVLIVVEPGQTYDSATDIPILVSSPSDAKSEAHAVLLNGSLTPPPLELRRGVRYRLRFANITTRRPGMRVEMVRDSALATWTPLAKDGADLPQVRRVARPARQPLSIGETADFEVTPAVAGTTRLEARTSSGALLGRLEMVVR